MTNEHISPEVMAQLADGASPADRRVLLRHLASCHRCAAIYAELVSHRADWLCRRDELPSSAELIRLGLSIPESVVACDTGAPRPRRASDRRFAFRGLAVAALLAVVITAAMWWWQRREPAQPAFVGDIARAVEQQMSKESLDVAYLEQIDDDGDATRNGSPHASDLSASLARLSDYYNHEAMSADVAYWLIGGYMTTGQMRNAEVYLVEALERFPADARIELLAGVLAYRQSDLATAERRFRAVTEKNPHDGVAHYNLAVVLDELGRVEEAESSFARAGQLLRGTPLAGHASKRLDQPAP